MMRSLSEVEEKTKDELAKKIAPNWRHIARQANIKPDDVTARCSLREPSEYDYCHQLLDRLSKDGTTVGKFAEYLNAAGCNFAASSILGIHMKEPQFQHLVLRHEKFDQKLMVCVGTTVSKDNNITALSKEQQTKYFMLKRTSATVEGQGFLSKLQEKKASLTALWEDDDDYYVVFNKDALEEDVQKLTEGLQEVSPHSAYTVLLVELFPEDELMVIGFHGSRLHCDRLECRIREGQLQNPHFAYLVRSWKLDTTVPKESHHYPWLVRLTSNFISGAQAKILSTFQTATNYLTSLNGPDAELTGTRMAREDMVRSKSALSAQLGVVASVLVWCPKCNKRVETSYDDLGVGSKLHCTLCGSWC